MQFEQGKAAKTYLAVVNASWRNKYLEKVITVRNFLADDREHHKQQVVLTSKKGKYAVTAFKLIGIKEDMALLTAEPQTGRTHQIRIHLQELEVPILGDTLYGGASHPRLCLHAYKTKGGETRWNHLWN
jgi:23S rRNA-/tRNA-specific pseudouridylate synthase